MKFLSKQVETQRVKKPENLDFFNTLTSEELKNTEGGIIPLLLGYVVGVALGAGGVCAGYKIAKYFD